MPIPIQHAEGFIVYNSDESGPLVIVTHWVPVGTVTIDQAQADAFAFELDDKIGQQLKGSIPADSTYQRSVGRLNDNGVIIEGTDQTNAGAGLIGGESCPDFTATIIRKRTAVGGRRGRGRWFIGCVPELWQDTGRLAPAGTVGYAALVVSLIQDIVSGGVTWHACHLSRADNTMIQIQAVTLHNVLGTQRRRRLRPAI